MALAAARFKGVVLLLIIRCLLLLPLFVGLLCVAQYLVSFLRWRREEQVALLKLSSLCQVAVSVPCLFLMVPLVGLQCTVCLWHFLVILTFHDTEEKLV